jgi:UDP-GlcNAc:undecaprenyl-phosphate GlcNAc-1-phosphate transferase
MHLRPIPYLGGLGFYLAFLVSGAVCFHLFTDHPALSSAWDNGQPLFQQPLTALVLGSFLVVLFGVVDDARGVRPRVKLVVQLLIGALAYSQGIRVEEISTPLSRAPIHLPPWLGFMATLFWMAAVMNAMNMIDGLDGLAAGIALIASVTIFFTAVAAGSAGLEALLACVVAGAMLGFLRYNFHPATIFMGDTGSMLLGFLLGTIAIYSTQKQATLLALFVPMAALGLPVIEVTSTFLRRLSRGQSLGLADREHLHYRLMHLGLTHRQTVLLMYYVSIFFGICAYLLSSLEPAQRMLVVLLMAMGLALGVATIWHLDRTRSQSTGRQGDAESPEPMDGQRGKKPTNQPSDR